MWVQSEEAVLRIYFKNLKMTFNVYFTAKLQNYLLQLHETV